MNNEPQELAGLSRRETQIMEILFTAGEGTVAYVTDNMPDKLSRNAIRTILTILEGKGRVVRRKEGREFYYSPSTDKAEAAQSALQRVLKVFFNGSLSDAVSARFDGGEGSVKEDELSALHQLIEQERDKRGE